MNGRDSNWLAIHAQKAGITEPLTRPNGLGLANRHVLPPRLMRINPSVPHPSGHCDQHNILFLCTATPYFSTREDVTCYSTFITTF